MPGNVNWPLAAGILAAVATFFKGLAVLWRMARSVERIELTCEANSIGIGEVKTWMLAEIPHRSAMDQRLGDIEDRLERLERLVDRKAMKQ